MANLTKSAEPQQKTAQPHNGAPHGFFDRLRALHTRLQCWAVRRRHRFRRYTLARRRAALERVLSRPLARDIGELLYSVGFQAEYTAIRTGRRLNAIGRFLLCVTGNAAVAVGTVIARVGKTVWHELLRPVYVFFRGIGKMFLCMRQVYREKNIFAALWAGICYFFRGIRRYANLVPGMFVGYIIPAASAALFLFVVNLVLHYNYTLAVQVKGETVGYVQSEQVFDNAKENVDERINYAGTSETSWDIVPSYTLSLGGRTLDENQMANAILRASGDEISEGAALYIDGELYAVTADGTRLQGYIEGLKAPYEEPDDPTVRVQFNRAVEIVDNAIFFTDSFTDCDAIITGLSGLEQAQVDYTVVAGDSLSLIASKNGLTMTELCELNEGLSSSSALYPGDTLIVSREQAVLEVQIVRTITYEEEIPYSTSTTNSSEYAWGVTKTIVEGQNGLKAVTADVTYDTQGNTLSTVITDETVLSEPVTKEVVKGTKLPTGSIASYGSGTFMWPVPNYNYCSRWYGGSHKGVDICAAYGTATLASDSGVVTAAGWNAAGSNYGYSVVINHGNGYVTVYAHFSAVYVSTGQSVSQGQLIGAVGSTGRSTGNHCHFEIRLNGVKLPPQNIFGRLR